MVVVGSSMFKRPGLGVLSAGTCGLTISNFLSLILDNHLSLPCRASWGGGECNNNKMQLPTDKSHHIGSGGPVCTKTHVLPLLLSFVILNYCPLNYSGKGVQGHGI